MQYAIRDRDGALHPESSRKAALRTRQDFGGQVIVSKNGDGTWKPWKRRRIFLWVFLAVQVLFLIWLISAAATSTGPSAAQVAQFCGHGSWQGVFTSHADCVKHGAAGLADAGNVGKGLAVGLIAGIWIGVDFLLAVTYGIYRLARR